MNSGAVFWNNIPIMDNLKLELGLDYGIGSPPDKLEVTDGKYTLRVRVTLTYKHGWMLGGSFNFDMGNHEGFKKFILQYADRSQRRGPGASVTYNRDYYGLDGWQLTALAYGLWVGWQPGCKLWSVEWWRIHG